MLYDVTKDFSCNWSWQIAYVSGFQTGFRGHLGFREGVTGIRRNVDENLGILYDFVITFTDFYNHIKL
jgi:hypothetical protein